MGWATALADPLIPEHIRAELHATAAGTAATQPAEWFTLTARLAAGLGRYLAEDDPWRTAGPPYPWIEDSDPSNRFEWETDVLPAATPIAAEIIAWALHPVSDPTDDALYHAAGFTASTRHDAASHLWPECDTAVRCLAARARLNDPLLDLRMTMIEEAWTAWLSL
ncbi:MAG: hypothetical protein ACRDJ9_26330 [Dehalococcoidia bacterium]